MTLAKKEAIMPNANIMRSVILCAAQREAASYVEAVKTGNLKKVLEAALYISSIFEEMLYALPSPEQRIEFADLLKDVADEFERSKPELKRTYHALESCAMFHKNKAREAIEDADKRYRLEAERGGKQ
jgi:hypothetical protein